MIRRSLTRRRRDEGQTLVEAAIMLPLYVFLILGIMQLGLMHQARLLTKYAAYKAVRAGALNNGDRAVMEKAAVAALLPLLPLNVSGAERIMSVETGPKMALKWPLFMSNYYLDFPHKIARVRICGPTQGDVGGGEEADFDDPAVGGQGDKTKLRVEVEFLYRMPIPFANSMIYAMAAGREITKAMRVGEKGPNPGIKGMQSMSMRGVYAIPIRASYAMRMHSNPFQKNLPGSNECTK